MRIQILIIGILLGYASLLKAQDKEVVPDFSQIQVFGKMQVRLIQSDTMRVNLNEQYEVAFNVKDGVLILQRTNNLTQPIETTVDVYYKQISKVTVKGGAKIINRGVIKTSKLNIVAKTGTEIDLIIEADTVDLQAKRNAMVYLNGEITLLNIKSCMGSDIRTKDLINKQVKITLRGGSAELGATEKIEGIVSSNGRLYYKQELKEKKIKESMGGKASLLEE